jgi:hypothetical protein
VASVSGRDGPGRQDPLRQVERKWAVKRPVVVPVSATAQRGFAAHQVVTQVDLPSGSYQFRVSAKSLTTGKAGSVYLAAEIPKVAALALGEVLVGAVDRPSSVLAPSPAGVASLPLPITLDRVFARSEHIRLFAKVVRTQGRGPLTSKVDFEDASGQVVQSIDAAFTKGDQAIDTTVDLSALAPGAYRARVTITAAGATASRDVSFVIRP